MKGNIPRVGHIVLDTGSHYLPRFGYFDSRIVALVEGGGLLLFKRGFARAQERGFKK